MELSRENFSFPKKRFFIIGGLGMVLAIFLLIFYSSIYGISLEKNILKISLISLIIGFLTSIYIWKSIRSGRIELNKILIHSLSILAILGVALGIYLLFLGLRIHVYGTQLIMDLSGVGSGLEGIGAAIIFGSALIFVLDIILIIWLVPVARYISQKKISYIIPIIIMLIFSFWLIFSSSPLEFEYSDRSSRCGNGVLDSGESCDYAATDEINNPYGDQCDTYECRVNTIISAWKGCRGSGVDVCIDHPDVTEQYFIDNPKCILNSVCEGRFHECNNIICPEP